MDYGNYFDGLLDNLRADGNYRVFAEILRERGNFPNGIHRTAAGDRSITVWCSNDYLAMAQHPVVLDAMHRALDAVGAIPRSPETCASTSA